MRPSKDVSSGYLPFRESPSKPSYLPPPGSVDAHCHVFGPREKFPFASERKYTPCDAPAETLFALRDFLGFDRSVIVQATCHGTDNRALLDALQKSQGRARGVASVDVNTSESELERLHAFGVRGVRFNFIKRLVDAAPTDAMKDIAARIVEFGWHIVVYTEQAEIEAMSGFLESLPTTLVFDHMACPKVEEGVAGREFQSWLRAVDKNRNWMIKVTCPERFSREPPPYPDWLPFAQTMVDRFGDRVMWGTDWPHPNVRGECPDDGQLTDLIPAFASTHASQLAMLVANPMRLYWPELPQDAFGSASGPADLGQFAS